MSMWCKLILMPRVWISSNSIECQLPSLSIGNFTIIVFEGFLATGLMSNTTNYSNNNCHLNSSNISANLDYLLDQFRCSAPDSLNPLTSYPAFGLVQIQPIIMCSHQLKSFPTLRFDVRYPRDRSSYVTLPHTITLALSGAIGAPFSFTVIDIPQIEDHTESWIASRTMIQITGPAIWRTQDGVYFTAPGSSTTSSPIRRISTRTAHCRTPDWLAPSTYTVEVDNSNDRVIDKIEVPFTHSITLPSSPVPCPGTSHYGFYVG